MALDTWFGQQDVRALQNAGGDRQQVRAEVGLRLTTPESTVVVDVNSRLDFRPDA